MTSPSDKTEDITERGITPEHPTESDERAPEISWGPKAATHG